MPPPLHPGKHSQSPDTSKHKHVLYKGGGVIYGTSRTPGGEGAATGVVVLGEGRVGVPPHAALKRPEAGREGPPAPPTARGDGAVMTGDAEAAMGDGTAAGTGEGAVATGKGAVATGEGTAAGTGEGAVATGEGAAAQGEALEGTATGEGAVTGAGALVVAHGDAFGEGADAASQGEGLGAEADTGDGTAGV